MGGPPAVPPATGPQALEECLQGRCPGRHHEGDQILVFGGHGDVEIRCPWGHPLWHGDQWQLGLGGPWGSLAATIACHQVPFPLTGRVPAPQETAPHPQQMDEPWPSGVVSPRSGLRDLAQPQSEERMRPRGLRPVVLAADGTGDTTSLEDAIAAAPRGGRVLIRPGRYRGGATIEHELELLGDGPVGECVIELDLTSSSADRPAIQALRIHGQARVAGLTVRVFVPDADFAYEHDGMTSAVFALGHLWIRDCHLSAQYANAVVTSGSMWMDECTIEASACGVYLTREGSTPTIRRCLFRDLESGIWVGSRGTREVDILDCGFERMAVGIGTAFRIVGRISGNRFAEVGVPFRGVARDW